MRARLMAVIGVVAAGLAHAAETFILPQMTAARETNAVVCLLTWLEVPKGYQVVAYRVYQAEAVGGPFVRVAQTTTNELLFVVEPGKHFWKVVAVNFWNAEGEPDVIIESPPMVPEVGSVTVKKVKAGGGKGKATVEMPPAVPGIEAGTVDMGVLIDDAPVAAVGLKGPAVLGGDLRFVPERAKLKAETRAKLPKDAGLGAVESLPVKRETKD